MRNKIQADNLKCLRLHYGWSLWDFPLSYLGYELGFKKVSNMELELAYTVSCMFHLSLQQLLATEYEKISGTFEGP